jgi:NADH-quinone oxidoreductase subunit I
MTNVYELADDDRGKLIFEKRQLLAPAGEGMVAAPHPMVAGMNERDYYQGNVAKATPEQKAWADARAAELASSAVSTLTSTAVTSAEGGAR